MPLLTMCAIDDRLPPSARETRGASASFIGVVYSEIQGKRTPKINLPATYKRERKIALVLWSKF